MVENKKDQIFGFVAVAVAFGWGDLAVEDLLPGEKLVIRAGGSYEASGYLEEYGQAKSALPFTPECHTRRNTIPAKIDAIPANTNQCVMD